jgi:hypothetical protein
MRTKKVILKVLIFSFSISICSVFVSENLNSRFEHRDETIKIQENILKGQSYRFDGEKQYFGAWQNRVMVPYVLWATAKMGVLQEREWYLIVRIFSALLCFFGFWWCIYGARNILHGAQYENKYFHAYVSTLLLFFCLTLTFNEPWAHVTDYFDSLFFAICAYLVVKKRYSYLFVLSIFASANRESAAFMGVVWAFCHGLDISNVKLFLGEFAKGFIMSVSSYASALGLRLAFGGTRAITETNQTFTLLSVDDKLEEFFVSPDPFGWPVLALALLTPPLLWFWERRQTIDNLNIKLLASSVAIALITMSFGLINELRIFIPSITLLIFSAALLNKK